MATKKPTKTVLDFKNYDFDSCDVPEKYWGDYPHANYAKGEFAPVLRRELKAAAKKIGAEAKVEYNYFDCSAVFKKDGKHVYVHIGDVRDGGRGTWYDRVLFRTMEHEKDWTGGSNNYCSFDQIGECVNRMFDSGF